MPLKEGKSKKAFEENIAIERKHGKPEKQALAIAYAVKRKNRLKKAEGGDINAEDETSVRPNTGFGKVIVVGKAEGGKVERGEYEKGVHLHDKLFPEKPGQSVSGTELREKDDEMGHKMTRRRHAGNLEELHSMPNPKLKGLAEGGRVNESAITERRPNLKELDNDREDVSENRHMKENKQDHVNDRPEMKQARRDKTFSIKPIDHPNMVESKKVHARLRDELDKIKYAEGGEINNEIPFDEAEEDRLEMPFEPKDDEEKSPEEKDFMSDEMEGQFAEGGEIHHEMDEQPEDEEDEDHESSIAATILARKARQEMLDSGSEDEDEAERFAHGGQLGADEDELDDRRFAHGGRADIESNEEEEPYGKLMNELEEESLEHHYGDDLDAMDQPEDSNEIGDDEESDDENEHDEDVVDRIMRNMHKTSPMVRRQRK